MINVILAVKAIDVKKINDVMKKKLVEFTTEMNIKLIIKVKVTLINEKNDVNIKLSNVIMITLFLFNTTSV